MTLIKEKKKKEGDSGVEGVIPGSMADLLGRMGTVLDRLLGRHSRPKMRFDVMVKYYLPYVYQDGQMSPPQPKMDMVKVERFPEWMAHVRSFGGFPSGLR
jgi:hypothetical protein